VASKGTAFKGVGLTFQRSFFDPTACDGKQFGPLYEALMNFRVCATNNSKSSVHVIAAALERSIVAPWDMSKVSETKMSTAGINVQTSHLDVLQSGIFNRFLHTSTNVKTSLNSLKCGNGVATQDSVMDGWFVDSNNCVRGNYEVKSSDRAPVESLRQAVAYGSNIALQLLDGGVPWHNVIVPIVSGNGTQQQFAAICLLEPSFPYAVVLSKVLDLCDDADRLLAAQHWFVLQKYVAQPFTLSPSLISPRRGLAPGKYHLKRFDDFFQTTGQVSSSLWRLFHMLSVAHRKLECRQTIVFPLCVRQMKAGIDHLVFPLLSNHTIGMPAELSVRDVFLDAVEVAMNAFHDAGVVHMDFYPSNIMWRYDDQTKICDVKIIDWDSVHAIGETLGDNVSTRLSEVRKQLFLSAVDGQNAVLRACREWDTSLLLVLRHFKEDPRLQTNDKSALDMAFRSVCSETAEAPQAVTVEDNVDVSLIAELTHMSMAQ
jgi:hypothetical protein